jgi:hypothetical protein
MKAEKEETRAEKAATESRRLLMLKRVLEALGWLAALALLAFAGHAVFAAPRAADAGVVSQQTARDGLSAAVAQAQQGAPDHGSAQDGGNARDRGNSRDGDGESESSSRRERGRRASGRAEMSAAALMRDARTLYIAPTEHLDKTYLEYKLHKYRELDDWNLMLVADPRQADLVLTVDKTALNYIFHITDVRTTVIVASGKCVAINSRVAAEFLGKEIVNKIRDVRASDRRPRKKRRRDDDADEDEGESSS